eukprot:CAMPEP_0182903588 /NCGR_PEP_ID=MMETSP0034_2-20130328/31404_1 /TAXON_ID=156128 /ORGANISM="Nephroselmis pyriformis, Strain CCMP717" /LENGTH=525 /DNA_ID=CAMNT_0025038513 /DNA_START=437 /DNA_END=2011 /DNA_ORIENTATION=-
MGADVGAPGASPAGGAEAKDEVVAVVGDGNPPAITTGARQSGFPDATRASSPGSCLSDDSTLSGHGARREVIHNRELSMNMSLKNVKPTVECDTVHVKTESSPSLPQPHPVNGGGASSARGGEPSGHGPSAYAQANLLLGRRVAKVFDSKVYYGTVDRFLDPFFHVTYDDMDEEEYNRADLEGIILPSGWESRTWAAAGAPVAPPGAAADGAATGAGEPILGKNGVGGGPEQGSPPSSEAVNKPQVDPSLWLLDHPGDIVTASGAAPTSTGGAAVPGAGGVGAKVGGAAFSKGPDHCGTAIPAPAPSALAVADSAVVAAVVRMAGLSPAMEVAVALSSNLEAACAVPGVLKSLVYILSSRDRALLSCTSPRLRRAFAPFTENHARMVQRGAVQGGRQMVPQQKGTWQSPSAAAPAAHLNRPRKIPVGETPSPKPPQTESAANRMAMDLNLTHSTHLPESQLLSPRMVPHPLLQLNVNALKEPIDSSFSPSPGSIRPGSRTPRGEAIAVADVLLGLHSGGGAEADD